MKILICIAFYYKQERLQYLRQVLHMQQFLAPDVHTIIMTDTGDQHELKEIYSVSPPITGHFKVEIAIFNQLAHPVLLTWGHKLLLEQRMGDLSYTHFMYSEDDIELTSENVLYWLRAREQLHPFGLYPSFFRVEWSEQQLDWMSTDIIEPISISKAPLCRLPGGNYMNLTNPYQGLFFYDRELMIEHVASQTFDVNKFGRVENIGINPLWVGGGVQETANFALTFENVPRGFTFRNVVPYFEKYRLLDPHCFVHHLPNNYANDKPESLAGKLRVKDVLCI